MFGSDVIDKKVWHFQLSVNKLYVPDCNSSSTLLTVPKNFTYEYFLKNAVDLPNTAKMQLFNLGTYLRKTYDAFLGSLLLGDTMEMRTTEFSVSIIAGELINAGLWPPVESQIWKEDLLWQPIPFIYDAAEDDTLLLGTLCPNFEYETNKVLMEHKLTMAQTKLLNYLNNEGKVKITNPIEVALLYFSIENSNELNQRQPDWLMKVFPSENMLNLTLTAYDLLSKTIVQKRLNGGSIIKTIIKHSKDKINGILSSDRKINIYSGDDRNLAGVLKVLKIPFYEIPHVGGALIFELFVEENKYFIKINYYTGINNEAIPYTLDGCDLFCPIEKFSELVADILVEDKESPCSSMMKMTDKENIASYGASAAVSLTSQTLFIAFSLISYHVIINILYQYRNSKFIAT
ncbi:PREDICTED: venom acid phosphatase Acph-1-like [Ceratosolen solmsi marchali]|uniref:acid phosphatase n=1 Tax=Ceratosolen solmsi marchali TaxID=326594 RepID=A0AAJ6YLJ5_9HYME|nr:PREDICTED: venom acid phosphatase Acph-1-like [Ceratosolen solmsi marchali]